MALGHPILKAAVRSMKIAWRVTGANWLAPEYPQAAAVVFNTDEWRVGVITVPPSVLWAQTITARNWPWSSQMWDQTSPWSKRWTKRWASQRLPLGIWENQAFSGFISQLLDLDQMTLHRIIRKTWRVCKGRKDAVLITYPLVVPSHLN